MAELIFKILLIGDSDAERNEIMYKYVDNSIPNNYYISKLGVEIKKKLIKINNYNNTLRIFNTAGQKHFRSLSSFSRGSDGIIFVYDITNFDSFSNIKERIIDLESDNTNIKYILCGNRVDLEEQRKVETETLKSFGLEMKNPVFEISSKTGYNLDEAFNKLVELIMKNKTDKELIKSYGANKIMNSLDLFKNEKGKEKLKNEDKPKNNFSNEKKEVYEQINTFKLDTKLDKLNIYINF